MNQALFLVAAVSLVAFSACGGGQSKQPARSEPVNSVVPAAGAAELTQIKLELPGMD